MFFNKILLILFFILSLNEKCFSKDPVTIYNDQVVNIYGNFGDYLKITPTITIQEKPCELFEYDASHISCYFKRLDECTTDLQINFSNSSTRESIVYSNLVCPPKPIVEKFIINYDEKKEKVTLTIAGNYFPTKNPNFFISLNNNNKKYKQESDIYQGVDGSKVVKCKGNLELNENYIICNSISKDIYESLKEKKPKDSYMILAPDASNIIANNDVKDYLLNNTILIKKISSKDIHVSNKSFKLIAYVAIPSFVFLVLIVSVSVFIHKIRRNKKK
ncbi:expressed protein [Dictyostelium purpureum]|uniref:Expressed protein n=1 Tax=Dictyostelium purpureum TaxID=5786 RepID=F0ZDM3_DICPU|nr:uncharacterized protein DICPUDRAFT_97069 [Dictyostelium purpureum]EGC37964.1 expressed protein [Dictyostelium purpureum]|eukprot:XP_003285535.1 expressed protein [Dictyostelium purpureum]